MYTDKLLARFWEKVEKVETKDSCWIWAASKNKYGYGLFNVRGQRPSNCWLAHRVSFQIANGPIPIGINVLHSCDNPACVNPSHLFLGSQADNMKDKAVKGRHPRNKTHYLPSGMDHPTRKKRVKKLTLKEALLIKKSADTQRNLAKKFGITTS